MASDYVFKWKCERCGTNNKKEWTDSLPPTAGKNGIVKCNNCSAMFDVICEVRFMNEGDR